MQGGILCAPIIVNLQRNKLNHDFKLRKMMSADLPNMPDENLLDLVEAEMLAKSNNRLYPFEKHHFGIKVKDDIESNTYGFFYCQNGVTFRFSSRLALNDVETIRRHYPNFLRLFKENLKSKWAKDLESVKENLRSAKTLWDYLNIFREKDLCHLRIDTSTLSDDELKKVLLTPNAKRFVISREVLLADSFYHAMPALHSFVAFGTSWGLFSLLKKRMPEKLAIAIAFPLAVIIFVLLDRVDQINELATYDKEAVEEDAACLSGAKEYLQSSIELGKLLYRLTDGKAPFDANGNCKRHKMKYTDRMKAIESIEKKMAKEGKPKKLQYKSTF
ncbi:hypothetical protein niasHS_006650 [Heterodera schachtii]|uniref:Uncharacterized protein n=1 Tax=Heterodera schachtii TaxID=97005 RepID=A0ABD2JHV8_HETSC